MKTKTNWENFLEKEKIKLALFDGQKDSDEYKNIKNWIDFLEANEETIKDEVREFKYTASEIKGFCWLSYFNGKIYGHVKYFKNGYVKSYKNLTLSYVVKYVN